MGRSRIECMIDTEVGTADSGLNLLTASQLAARISINHVELLERETTVLQLACAWADVHDIDSTSPDYQPLIERACQFGGDGTPEVSEYCAAEFGVLQGLSSMSGRLIIGDALDLRHRLPELWARVCAGGVRAWQARKVAQATRSLDYHACRDLDAGITSYLGLMPWGRFQKILDAAILEAAPDQAAARALRARTERDVWATDTEDGLKLLIARAASGDVTWFMATVNRIAEILALRGDTDPVGARRAKALGILAQPAHALQLLLDHQRDPSADPAGDDTHASLDLTSQPQAINRRDLDAVRPKAVLYFHLAESAIHDGHGLVRPEHGDILTLTQFRDFLSDTGCRLTVKPVLDPAAVAPADGYEIPTRVREAARLRQIADVFPYGTNTSKLMDLDHTDPYQPKSRGGPPGQTSVNNLGPKARGHHRAKTHGDWGERQPDPGTYVHRTPTGYVFVVTNQGTLGLGNTSYAHAVWRSANPVDEGADRPTAA